MMIKQVTLNDKTIMQLVLDDIKKLLNNVTRLDVINAWATYSLSLIVFHFMFASDHNSSINQIILIILTLKNTSLHENFITK